MQIRKMDNKEDKVYLSRKALERQQRWEELEEAFNNGTVLTEPLKILLRPVWSSI